MEIRHAVAEDFEGVFGLLAQLWPDSEMNKEALKILYINAVNSTDDYALCAVSEGDITGFCAGVIATSYWCGGKACYISTMIVDAEHRNNKTGSALLEAAEQYARGRGCVGVEVESAFHREGAHRFYEKHGYAKAGFAFEKRL